MKHITSKLLGLGLLLLLLTSKMNAQTTTVDMIFGNTTITSNTIEFDVFIKNTGTDSLGLRGYSFGLNHNPGMDNGGTITHSYISGSRDSIFANLPAVTPGYSATLNHIRATTTTSTAGSEVFFGFGIPVKLGRFRLTNTVNWASGFVPNFQAQVLTQSSRTQCLVTCYNAMTMSSVLIFGTGNTPSSTIINGLTAVINMPGLTLGSTCSGMPNAGIAIASNSNLCPNETLMLTLTGTTYASDLTFQWQRSPNGNTNWLPLNGATALTYTYIPPANSTTYYRCIVGCPSSGQFDTSSITSPVGVQLFYPTSPCYCVSTFSGASGADIGQFTFGGIANPSIAPSPQVSNSSSIASYTNFMSLSAQQFFIGNTYPLSIQQITSTTSLVNSWVKVFIDYNHNTKFTDPGEEVFSSASNASNGFFPSSNMTIPATALTGLTRLRVVLKQQGNATNTNSCTSSYLGETEDYIVNIIPACIAPNLTFNTPTNCGNGGNVTMHVYGGCLDLGTNFQLVQGIDTISVPNGLISNLSGQQLTATFNLLTADTGYYDVVVTTPLGFTMTISNGLYVNTGNLDDPEAFIIGPTNLMVNTWTQYSIICENSGNVNSTGNILWIAVPQDIAYQFNSIPFNPTGSTVTFDSIPKALNVNNLFGVSPNYKVIPLFIGTIGPNSTKYVPIKFKSPTLQSFDIKAWCTSPLYNGSLNSAQSTCLSDAATNVSTTTVPTFVPPTSTCLYNGMHYQYSTYQNCTNGCNIQPLYWSCLFAEFINSCAPQPSNQILANGVQDVMNILLSSNTNAAMNLIGSNCGAAFWPPLPPKVHLANVVSSLDPNAKYGPSSYDTSVNNYISNDNVYNYLISCENDNSATAAAQVVTILDTLDISVYDLTTFQLGPITIGDTTIQVPTGLHNFHTQADLSNIGIYFVCDIQASLDLNTGIASWIFTTLDQNTLLPVTAALDGFLPPNINSPEGEASVNFSIKVYNNIPLNTHIDNKAFIYFDNNPFIATDNWHNTIDNANPISHVQVLPAYSDSSFTIQWSGNDAESGILTYNIYYSVNGSPYQLLLHHTSTTSYQFMGNNNTTYSFYSVAIDKAGNMESIPSQADATTVTRDCQIVLQPTLDTIGNVIFCQGNSVTFNVSGGNSYLWSNGEITNSILVDATGSYSVMVSDTFLCNYLINTTNVQVLPLPTIAITASNNNICQGATTTLTASGAATYFWPATANTNSVINISPSTTSQFLVSGIGYNGCENSDSIQITVNPLPTVTINVSDTTLCLGNTVILTGNNGLFYNWQPTNEITSVITQLPSSTTQYTLTGTDINACSNTATILITVMPLPTAPIITNSGSNLQSNYPNGNQWYLNNVLIPGANQNTFTPTLNGDYTVVYTDAFGCISTSSIFSYIPTSINDLSNTSSVFAYPNPTTGTINIEGYDPDGSIVDLFIYNLQGQLVSESFVKSKNHQFQKQMDINKLAKGVYTLVLKTTSWNKIIKIVKE